MKYLMIATKTRDGRYRAIMPDFPGDALLGVSLESLAADAQTFVENWMRKRRTADFPQPGSVDSEAMASAPGAICALVDIDPTFLDRAKVRVNISIPAYALQMIDRGAKKAGLNRSEYLVKKALA